MKTTLTAHVRSDAVFRRSMMSNQEAEQKDF
jgi:hypothetical protein